ncbi:Signal transduction histidine kinase [Cupriavidus necator H16]|uniref:histidine kinase n=1 Tax=Cupriavidus necator (strain ATCC 17699 / DSM 428 / KCTC 22496 / NCIMB 10442 / H16 / Stanier 337) TaxID=381666 RepID=Q0K728_CUPNH|nr:hybrid sensor histidine kinase/response regulator [Cupriavidus necator]QCC01957.1 hybrid sensor histidine kinase/response regulator [Cupriavidus necator H16]QQB75211.1 hybrid sensor histidine kinase/response regulator [Cupriavidus necator]WKA40359.1 hybrid sensor histidine kinase/response regulator [Cupriavidus necator]CAJ94193.1 signal transduction histidine kinase containing a receiver domain (hybrid) [Cupriavidus necator H16]
MSEAKQARLAVLYVDDEEMARKYFARAAGSDYEVLVADSADEALAVLRADPARVAVLVTDFRMPGRDGGQLLRQVAQEYPQIVRILVTAYADKDVLLETVNSGEVFRILEKPLSVADLREVLAGAAERHRERHRERTLRQHRLMAIDETLAFLAHELNTPLAAIANFAHGIRGRVAGEYSAQRQAEIGQAASAMYDNAQYCLAVLSSFLQSVRNSAGSTPARPDAGAEVSAGSLVTSLLDSYPFAGDQRSWVQVEMHGDFPVQTLPNCVALVLSSVMSNALRALGSVGTPALRFVVVAQPRPEIRICDNGPGIAPEVMERLLVDPVTTHASAGGSGLGMIFCNRVMQSFGGGIRIESASGAGTTVTLDFPSFKSRKHRSDR